MMGDFNGWDRRSTPMQYDPCAGRWQVTLTLPAGRSYRFHYLLGDREWLEGCYAGGRVQNCNGSYDSVLNLAGGIGSPAH
jgi:hypothetical protein